MRQAIFRCLNCGKVIGLKEEARALWYEILNERHFLGQILNFQIKCCEGPDWGLLEGVPETTKCYREIGSKELETSYFWFLLLRGE